MISIACATPSPGAAQAPASCDRLVLLQLGGALITSAKLVPVSGNLPEYCDVLGTTDSTIGFEVRLPTQGWNRKLYFGGNGGFAGRLRHDTSSGLSRRYATVSTDTGHRVRIPELDVLDASWALDNPRAELDYGFRAVHLATVAAKEVIRAYYGLPATLAYFQGCSNGGRQALQEALRYAEDFDGLIAGDPTLDLTGTFLSQVWNLQAEHATEARTDLSSRTLEVVGDAVLAACDATDGLRDGLISDPRRCNFRPRSLLCEATPATPCLTEVEVQALEKIYGGPRSSSGEPLYPGLSPGGERPDGTRRGWDRWLLHRPDRLSEGLIISRQFLRYLAFQPDRPEFEIADFDVSRHPQEMRKAAEILDATSVDLSRFQKRGGKLLLHQGWSDALLPPLRTVAYFEGLQARFGPEVTNGFARLFLAPGAYHCGGGPGPNELDALTALEQWVESGHPPDSMVATHRDSATGRVDRTRPLCSYPMVAQHDGRGPIDDAASFHCSPPAGIR